MTVGDAALIVNKVSLVFHVASFRLGICETESLRQETCQESGGGHHQRAGRQRLKPCCWDLEQQVYSLERWRWADRRGLSFGETVVESKHRRVASPRCPSPASKGSYSSRVTQFGEFFIWYHFSL